MIWSGWSISGIHTLYFSFWPSFFLYGMAQTTWRSQAAEKDAHLAETYVDENLKVWRIVASI